MVTPATARASRSPHVGDDEAGRDDVGADAVRLLLDRERAAERLQRHLAHHVRRAARHDPGRVDAGDQHHVAAVEPAHLRQQRLAQPERTVRQCPHHPVELVRVGLDHDVAAARDAGVADQHVHAAVVGEHRLGHPVQPARSATDAWYARPPISAAVASAAAWSRR